MKLECMMLVLSYTKEDKMDSLSPYLEFLIQHELIHLSVAVLFGILIYRWYESFHLVALLIGISLFMDVDHLFDCVMALGSNFNVKDMVQGTYWAHTDKLFVLLHSWELLIPVWVICCIKKRFDIGVTITLAFLGHILVDQFTYTMHPLAYSFIYRMLHGFKSAYFTGESFLLH